MRCGEIREYVFAFLDNELDVPLSIEFQRHLELCHDCAREVEIEWAVKRKLGEVLGDSGLRDPIDEGMPRRIVGRDVAGAGRINRRRRVLTAVTGGGRYRFPSVIAAAVVLVFGAWLALRERPEAGTHSRFVKLVVTDFEHFLEEGKHVQIASDDPQAVSQWLRDKTQLAVILPASPGGDYKLLGGRKCEIDGRPAAYAVYDIRGVPASLVAVSAEEGMFEGLERIRRAGPTHCADTFKGHTVVAVRRGGLVYAAVSKLQEREILRLLTDLSNEGD